MIVFLLGFLAALIILYSVSEMKIITGYNKNENRLRRLLANPYDVIVIGKFFKNIVKNENRDLRKQYLKISLIFVFGIIVFLGLVFYEIKYG
jgi:hypothetical protein